MTYFELCRTLSAAQSRSKPPRSFAVLAPVVEEGDALSLLFEVRAKTLRTQPGEICFPGGAVEEGETPRQAALREATEELGLSPLQIEPGPHLEPQYHQAGFITYPLLGRLAPSWRESLRLNPAEVGEIFTVPLDFFRTVPPEVYRCQTLTQPPEDFPYEKIGFPQGYPWRRGEMDVPLWMWEGHPIWGLTARIVHGLVQWLA